jgi:hypothetical protein
MVRGKILKAIREDQVGTPAHSTRLATLAAFKANLTTQEEFRADAQIVKRQNSANHGSPLLKRTPWADYSIEDEDTENNKNLTNIITTALDKWWSSKHPPTETSTCKPNVNDHGTKSTPSLHTSKNRLPHRPKTNMGPNPPTTLQTSQKRLPPSPLPPQQQSPSALP